MHPYDEYSAAELRKQNLCSCRANQQEAFEILSKFDLIDDEGFYTIYQTGDTL